MELTGTCAPDQALGLNLSTIRQWSAEQMMVNILDPNREVAPNFIQYAIELRVPEEMALRIREISQQEMLPESAVLRRLAMVGLRQYDANQKAGQE